MGQTRLHTAHDADIEPGRTEVSSDRGSTVTADCSEFCTVGPSRTFSFVLNHVSHLFFLPIV